MARRLAAGIVAAVLGCAGPGGDGAPESTGAAESGPAGEGTAPESAAGRPARVVLVSIAGLTPDRYLAFAPAMPLLAEIGRLGVAVERVEPVVPASLYPVHATLVTGRPPREHGVAADRLLGEHGVRRELYSHARHLRGVPLWQIVEAGGGTAAAIDWPGTVGASLSLLLPDLAPAYGQLRQGLLQGSTTPWLLELALGSNVDLAVPGPARDAFLAEAACLAARTTPAPRLVLLRLSQTGPVLAAAGPGSEAARTAFGRADVALGRLLACLRDGALLTRTALVVAGDRAFRPVHSVLRGNRVLLDAGLVSQARSGAVAEWQALVRSTGGTAFVYARDADAALAARRALDAAAERSGAFRVIGADEMIALGTDPQAWFGLAAEPGFVWVDDLAGPLLGPSRRRGAPGHLAGPGDPGPGLVLAGRGLRAGLRVPRFRQLDVAPTVAALLGVSLPEGEGQAMAGLLALEAEVAGGERVGEPLDEDGAAGAASGGSRWRVEVNP